MVDTKKNNICSYDIYLNSIANFELEYISTKPCVTVMKPINLLY